MELDSLLIPMMSQNYSKTTNESLNAIFMVRIKIGAESNCIIIASPNRILDPLHQKMSANIDSLNDKVYLEFYDVINETAFDAKTGATDMSNMKLLALHVFDVKDFAFNALGECRGHRILLPVEHSGNVCQLTFNAMFIPTVEELKMPIEVNEPYLLFMKMIQSVKEVMHHPKDLDLAHLVCDVKNVTRDKKASKRLYFNKEIYPVGYVPCGVGDQIKITFSVK